MMPQMEFHGKTPQTVCVVGLGYVGLTLSVVLSEVGLAVVGVDRRQEVVETLRSGTSHFFEVGLDAALRQQIDRNLRFSTEVVTGADMYVVAVGTPVGLDHEPMLGDLQGALESVARCLRPGGLVILRSTVPVGTTRGLALPILEQGSGLRAGEDFALVFAPERTIEGKALAELHTLPQIIGGLTQRCLVRATAFFEQVTPTTMNVASLEAAEMVKIVNNTYRDVTFGFANEIALFCQKLNIDCNDVIHAANSGYERSRVPKPSPGVGGDCLSKDPYIFMSTARRLGLTPKIVPAARQVNMFMPQHVIERIETFAEHVGVPLMGAQVLLLGVAFKGYPETSDVRSSPAIDVARALQAKGVVVFGYDPRVTPEVMKQHGIVWVRDVQDMPGTLLALAIMNNHHTFADPATFSSFLKQPAKRLLFDPWNLHQSGRMLLHEGLDYADLSYDTFSRLT